MPVQVIVRYAGAIRGGAEIAPQKDRVEGFLVGCVPYGFVACGGSEGDAGYVGGPKEGEDGGEHVQGEEVKYGLGGGVILGEVRISGDGRRTREIGHSPEHVICKRKNNEETVRRICWCDIRMHPWLHLSELMSNAHTAWCARKK